jgi:hypothetical protein
MGSNPVIVMPSGTSRGGAEEALRQLLGHREAAGFEKVTVVCLEPGDLPEVLRATGVTVEEVDAGRLRAIAFNETWVTLRYATGWRRTSMLPWQFGSRACLGLVVGILEIARGRFETGTRFTASMTGRWEAVQRDRQANGD